MATKVAILFIHGIGEKDSKGMIDDFVNYGKNCFPDIRYVKDPSSDLDILYNADYFLNLHEYSWVHIPNKPEYTINQYHITSWLSEIISDVVHSDEVINNDLNDFDGWKWGVAEHLIKSIYLTHPWINSAGRWICDKIPYESPVMRYIREQLEHFYVKVIGDIVSYVNDSDGAREEILGGLKEKIHELLTGEYDRVILVGHSLGSVIAYDALQEMYELVPSMGRLVNFVSVGSPLDKVHKYVDGYYHDNQGIEGLVWYNYFSESDIISAALDCFGDVKNYLVIDDTDSVFAHGDYFKNPRFYEHFYYNYLRAVTTHEERQEDQGNSGS